MRLRGPGGNLSVIGRLVRDAEPLRRHRRARDRAAAATRSALGTDPDVWRSLTQPFEAKFGGLRGGRDQVEAGTPSAGQYDTSVIDLATGEMRRAHAPSRSRRRHPLLARRAVGGPPERADRQARRVPRTPAASAVHRLDRVLDPLRRDRGRAGRRRLRPGSNPNQRDCYVDPWLLDRWFERGDYIGQRLLKPEDGWVSIEGNAGGFGWSPDGTKIALIERRWRALTSLEPSRLRIASFTSRAPLDPARRGGARADARAQLGDPLRGLDRPRHVRA